MPPKSSNSSNGSSSSSSSGTKEKTTTLLNYFQRGGGANNTTTSTTTNTTKGGFIQTSLQFGASAATNSANISTPNQVTTIKTSTKSSTDNSAVQQQHHQNKLSGVAWSEPHNRLSKSEATNKGCTNTTNDAPNHVVTTSPTTDNGTAVQQHQNKRKLCGGEFSGSEPPNKQLSKSEPVNNRGCVVSVITTTSTKSSKDNSSTLQPQPQNHKSPPKRATIAKLEAAAVIKGRCGAGSDLVKNDQYPIGRQNAHPRDVDIFMKESTHTYVMRGSSKFMTSVTTLLHDFFPEFDAIKVSESANCQKNIKYRGMSPARIRAEWDYQRDLGTRLHAKLEHYYQGLLTAEEARKDLEQLVEWCQFEDWDRREIQTRSWVMFHPEWMIFDEDLYLAGSMDAPFAFSKDRTNEIIIVDYKRTTGIDSGAFRGATGKGPCRNIPDCKVGHYTVQLNVYKYKLEKWYDVKVVGMYLAVFHPDQEFPNKWTPPERKLGTDQKPCTYRFIEIESQPEMVEEIMALRRHEVISLKSAFYEEQQSFDRISRQSRGGTLLLCAATTFEEAAEEQRLERELDALLSTLACSIKVVPHATLWPTSPQTSLLVHCYERHQRQMVDSLSLHLSRDLCLMIQGFCWGGGGGLLQVPHKLAVCVHPTLWDDVPCRDMVALTRGANIPVRVLGNE